MHLKLVKNPPEPQDPQPTTREADAEAKRKAKAKRKATVAKAKKASQAKAPAKKTKASRRAKRAVVQKIGHEKIFPLQAVMAADVMEMLLANESSRTLNRRSPLVILPPQGGKTGVIIEVIDEFVDDCIARKRTFQVVVLCGLPHLDLTGQTMDRLTQSMADDGETQIGAKLHLKICGSDLHRYPIVDAEGRPLNIQNKGIVILHNSQKLRRLNLNTKVDVRLWIGDEVHLGNVKGGNIDRVLQCHGVKLCEQIRTWGTDAEGRPLKHKTVNHFVGVSATPSAHLIKSPSVPGLEGDTLFDTRYREPPPEYNSLAKMRRNGRLKDTEDFFIDKVGTTPSAFFRQVEKDFHAACKAYGPGHLVIRATGRKHRQLLAYINAKGRRTEVSEFDAEKNNIVDLRGALAKKPAAPTIVVLRGSMRAGITLPEKHHIRGWVETESATADAPTQSGAGRACGYGRNSDKYPIYCDLAQIDKWIEQYESLAKGEVRSVPSGVQNKGTKERSYYDYWKTMSHDAAQEKYVRPFNDRFNETKDARFRRQISKTSANVLNDVAGMFLEGSHDSMSTVGILVDGPLTDEAVQKFLADKRHRSTTYTEEHVRTMARKARASYELLLKKYPGSEGKALLYKISPSRNLPDGTIDPASGLAIERKGPASGQSRDELQKVTSGTRKTPKN